MGKVMAAANKKLAGKSDSKTISEVVKSILGIYFAACCRIVCFNFRKHYSKIMNF